MGKLDPAFDRVPQKALTTGDTGATGATRTRQTFVAEHEALPDFTV